MLWHVYCLPCQGRTPELLLLVHDLAVPIASILPSLQMGFPFGALCRVHSPVMYCSTAEGRCGCCGRWRLPALAD